MPKRPRDGELRRAAKAFVDRTDGPDELDHTLEDDAKAAYDEFVRAWDKLQQQLSLIHI